MLARMQLLMFSILISTGAKALSPPELYQKFKPAIVKITIRQQEIAISTGTGFFVSPYGHIITNHHVLRQALKNPNVTADIELADKRVYRGFYISHCSDHTQLDVCLIKLPIESNSWFKIIPQKISVGDTAYVIGHPQGLDFSISSGMISAVRKSPEESEQIQISTPINPGNSGGPVFNSSGSLIGVANKFIRDGQSLSFGTSINELVKFYSQIRKFVSIASFHRWSDQDFENKALRWTADYIGPAYQHLSLGQDLSQVKGFKPMQFAFEQGALQFFAPEMFGRCNQTFAQQTQSLECSALNETVRLSITHTKLDNLKTILKFNGKVPVASQPLQLTRELIENGTWAIYQSRLSTGKKKMMFTIPGEAECEPYERNVLSEAFFKENFERCDFSIYNDGESDSYSHVMWLFQKGHLYSFRIWMENPNLAAFFNEALRLSVSTAQLKPAIPIARKSKPNVTIRIKE